MRQSKGMGTTLKHASTVSRKYSTGWANTPARRHALHQAAIVTSLSLEWYGLAGLAAAMRSVAAAMRSVAGDLE